MEEYLPIPKQNQQSNNPTFDSNLELPQLPKVNKNLNQHRHVSLIYGLQFQSKVSLFARQQSQSTTLNDFQNISKEEIYKKVLTFLKLVLTDSSMFEAFIKPFKILDEEMQLSIKKSRISIHSNSGQINFSSGSDCSSKNNIRKVFTLLINSNSPHEIEEQDTSKTRAQMMIKSNRVSLAQAISISQLHKFANLQAIQSAQILQSFQSSLKEFKSKRRLSCEQSENKKDCKSIPQIIALVNKPSERKNKISIMLIDDLSVKSQLFSQGQTGLSLSDIKLPGLKVDQMMLEIFFDPPSPYLINLSLCLFCKCLSRGLVSLKENSIGWLLGVSTIVAYKLYYDEPIEGLFEWFCEGMSMELSDLIKLQRWFLGSLKYEAAVSTQQYQNILMRLMTIS